MNLKRISIISFGIVTLLFFGTFYSLNTAKINTERSTVYQLKSETPHSSSETNLQNLNSGFDNKINLYNNNSFFPQAYEISLQATYYGVYILKALGKLNLLNPSQLINYIMSTYNASTHIFMDKYAYRYLDTDFSQVYYSLSTQLEVNCYAILSLSYLDALDRINIAETIDFLWSCYNPIAQGFIGQPFSSQLEEEFKIPTLDNTFYAIQTLDLLMDNWTQYSEEKIGLSNYIKSLQITSGLGWNFGGFNNDNSSSFNSLTTIFEPNLFSAYYGIKSLQILGLENNFNQSYFNQFMAQLYNPNFDYFRISLLDYNVNFTNLVATAIGLELSQITGLSTINQTELVDFLFTNRNPFGFWEQSTTISYHELIDTFQIIRSLNNTSNLNILNSSESLHLANNVIEIYYAYDGFSLISKEHTTIDQLHTVVTAFDLYERLTELPIPELYIMIRESYFREDFVSINGFYETTLIDPNYRGFRSFPIEFYSSGNKKHLDEIGYLLSHKATFKALDSLNRLYKLDDFALTHDLEKLLDDIIKTQFLNTSYPNLNGAFLP
ncbi:MAG: prenyltransferase/squalene oxidase repeat-containing protein, partial [Promethearchaeota archaeon]